MPLSFLWELIFLSDENILDNRALMYKWQVLAEINLLNQIYNSDRSEK
jgi:hypothetical protein